MSDANTAFVQPNDEGRNQVLWLDDLTRAETEEFLDIHAPLRPEVLGRTTCRASQLNALCCKGNLSELQTGAGAADIVTAFVNKSRLVAFHNVRGLLSDTTIVDFERLMQEMIDNGGSVTTTQAWFVNMATAAEEIHANQAIQLNVVTGVHSFNSAADAIAAEKELAARRSRRGVVRRFLNISAGSKSELVARFRTGEGGKRWPGRRSRHRSPMRAKRR
ncbi:hypothetical protein T492DRAFT_444494 [Pavlovales sp. CCMP2436]|nr:hypothetical protein T492DRAFT_444494 [Pavlovales sp. CCMP2436]